MKNPLTLAGIETATYRFVAQHLNHCATCTVNKWARRLLGRHIHGCHSSVGPRGHFLCSAATESRRCPQQWSLECRATVTENSGASGAVSRGAAQFGARENKCVKLGGGNKYFQRLINFVFLIKYKKIEKKMVILLKFIISVRGCHGDYPSRRRRPMLRHCPRKNQWSVYMSALKWCNSRARLLSL